MTCGIFHGIPLEKHYITSNYMTVCNILLLQDRLSSLGSSPWQDYLYFIVSLSETLYSHSISLLKSTFVWSNFRSIQRNIVLIENALRGDLVIPEFNQLTKPIEEIYHNCKENKDGKVMLLTIVKILNVQWNHVCSGDVYFNNLSS